MDRNENGEESDQEDEVDYEEEKAPAAPVVVALPSPQSTIVVRNLPGDVEESTLWRLFGPFGAVQDIRLGQGDGGATSCTNIQEAVVTMRSAREAALAIRALDGLRLDRVRNRSGELEREMMETQLKGPCDGRILEEFDQSVEEDLDVGTGQGQTNAIGQGQGQTKTNCQGQVQALAIGQGQTHAICQGQAKMTCQGQMVDKSQEQICNLEMDQGFIPTAAGLLATQVGLASLCQGQAIDGGLWTNNTLGGGGGYAINSISPPTACWLNDLESFGFYNCSQPGFINIYPQDIQTTFHLSCS